MAERFVYSFRDPTSITKDLRGGKGAGLAEMTNANLPVPPGFTITTEACREFINTENNFPSGMWEQTLQALQELEIQAGKKLGDPNNPLLVSVRSGGASSMPGMMDTVLNLGLNEESVIGLENQTGDKRFAQDSYRRFVEMFGRIVMGVDGKIFDEALVEIKKNKNVSQDTDLDENDLREAVNEFKNIIREKTGRDIPSDPMDQLRLAVSAVFKSWMGDRAIVYRNAKKISHDLGTAVNIQQMVFGNMGETSGTGVAFTRDPATGEKKLYGEFLPNAQGEDVVAGKRTPIPISRLHEILPSTNGQFTETAEELERRYRDVQDIEFTIESGKLYLLQKRVAQRTARAAVKIAVDMVDEGRISKDEAIMRVKPEQIDELLHSRFDPKQKLKALAEGRLLTTAIPASPGAVSGEVIFDSNRAKTAGEEGRKFILVRPETSPDDIHGMIPAEGILTSRGGKTSHAAVVARGMGKSAVVGAESLDIDLEYKKMIVKNRTIKEGDWISMDGETGEIFLGKIGSINPSLEDNKDLFRLLEAADERAKLKVWANADTPTDAERAREFGAKGIGLCRTEHMFFKPERLPIVQKMILSAPDANNGDKKAKEEHNSALSELLTIQREDFKEILKTMDRLPVVIRLLDPPLHEFLPKKEELLVEMKDMKDKGEIYSSSDYEAKKQLLERVKVLAETNPMMGLRGVRLGLMFPGINEMQVRAIFEAACELKKEGLSPRPKIMIPLVAHVNELSVVQKQLKETAQKVMQEQGMEIDYKFGTMIEVPRAALTSDKIAELAEFFSFGTNDLTQMTYGISRDDAELKFLRAYVEKKILPENPFETIDEEGVGELIKMAIKKGRLIKPDLEIGICGEHGGDPKSVEFFNSVGLNYVSASPLRVPVARLAAAQAQIKEETIYESNKT